MIRHDIEKAITAALQSLGAEAISFVVERPGSMEYGDYASNVALAAFSRGGRQPNRAALKEMLGREMSRTEHAQVFTGVETLQGPVANPQELAKKIVEKIGLIDGVKNIEVVGAGFINFTLAGNKVKDIVHQAHEKGWGSNDSYNNKTVMVEYTDPNPFKEFHIGHLMSNAIGESIARLFEYTGAKVVRANYQGDVGPHVAKALFVLLEKGNENPTITDISAAYVEGSKRYEENETDKEAIDQLNKKIYEKSDERVNALYTKGRELSLAHFEELYNILGTTFDFYFFESETGQKGLEIVKAHPEIFEKSEESDAIIFKGEKVGLHTRVFINKLGLPTYEAKELGLAEAKKKNVSFDTSVTITASEQTEYFKVVMAALMEVHPEWEGQFTHVSHGMMRFASGKMSSRKGNVVTGESLLMDLKDAAAAKMNERKAVDPEKVAEQVAVGAIKYAVLRQGSGKDIVFDPEKSLSVEGDSGPYLQYALVRARALLRNAASATVVPPQPAGPMPVERLVIYFPDVVARAASELEPHYVTTYLTELASAFNSWYATERMIVDGTITTRTLAVVKAIENTLVQGLTILGIPAPEEM